MDICTRNNMRWNNNSKFYTQFTESPSERRVNNHEFLVISNENQLQIRHVRALAYWTRFQKKKEKKINAN